jgi:hypothetical protein
MKNEKATQELELNDPIKESYLTAEVFKADKRIKKGSRYGKNRKGLRYINCIDFRDMSEDEITEQLSESWNPKNGYSFNIIKTYSKRKNIMSGKLYYERYDTPNYCSPSSESYWSM